MPPKQSKQPKPSITPISYHDIVRAHERIAPFVKRTPIITSELLNQFLGHHFYFKAECLQKVGAFKARGACNTIAKLIEKNNKPQRLVANSSGNHAQAVAWAAKQFDIPATIFMPKNVSQVKAQATKAYGAEVVLCESRDIADKQVFEATSEKGTVWIPPYNHPDVIAGQGTACDEGLNQVLTEFNTIVDCVVAPCGGGGLLSGSVVACEGFAQQQNQAIKVIGAEPLNANDAANSLRSGKIERLTQTPNTLADGAMTPSLGEHTFEFIKRLEALYEIHEERIAYWTQWLQHLLKLHIEPTSAMSMEAVCQWLKDKPKGQHVMVILSGGNIDVNNMGLIWQKDHLTTLPSLL